MAGLRRQTREEADVDPTVIWELHRNHCEVGVARKSSVGTNDDLRSCQFWRKFLQLTFQPVPFYRARSARNGVL